MKEVPAASPSKTLLEDKQDEKIRIFSPLLGANIPPLKTFIALLCCAVSVSWLVDDGDDHLSNAAFLAKRAAQLFCALASVIVFFFHMLLRTYFLSTTVPIQPSSIASKITSLEFWHHNRHRESYSILTRGVSWLLLLSSFSFCILLLFASLFSSIPKHIGLLYCLVFSHLYQVYVFSHGKLNIFWCFPVPTDFSFRTKRRIFFSGFHVTLTLSMFSLMIVGLMAILRHWNLSPFLWGILDIVKFPFHTLMLEDASELGSVNLFFVTTFVVFLLELQIFHLNSFVFEKYDFGVKTLSRGLDRLRQPSWAGQLATLSVLERGTRHGLATIPCKWDMNPAPRAMDLNNSVRRDLVELRLPPKIRFESNNTSLTSLEAEKKKSFFHRLVSKLPTFWDLTPLAAMVRDSNERMLPSRKRPADSPMILSAFAAGRILRPRQDGVVYNTFVHELLFSRDDQTWRELSSTGHRKFSDLSSLLNNFVKFCSIPEGTLLPVFVGNALKKLVHPMTLAPNNPESLSENNTAPINLKIVPLVPILEGNKIPTQTERGILLAEIQERLLLLVTLSFLYLKIITNCVMLSHPALDRRKIIHSSQSSKELLVSATSLHRSTEILLQISDISSFSPPFRTHLWALNFECKRAICVALSRVDDGELDYLHKDSALFALSSLYC